MLASQDGASPVPTIHEHGKQFRCIVGAGLAPALEAGPGYAINHKSLINEKIPGYACLAPTLNATGLEVRLQQE